MSEKENKVSAKVLVKSSFWYTISHFLTKAMAFITTPIFARMLTKQEYGDFAVFASWQSILLVICGLEVYATLNRARFDYKSKEKLNGYISSCLVLSSTITLIVFSLYLVFPQILQRLFLLDQKYMYWMFAYLLTYPAIGMFQTKQRVEYHYRLNAALSFFLIVVSSVLAVALVHFHDSDRLIGRIAGQYGPYITLGAILYFYFISRSHSVRLKDWKYALAMAVPLAFSYLGSHILLSSDKVVVQHLCSSEEVALLGMATTCSHIILIFVQTLNNAWSPWFYDKLNTNEYKSIRKTYSIYIWFIAGCTFCILMIGPEILSILGGNDYIEALPILPINMLCGIFTALNSQFVNLETYHKKAYYSAILTSIIAMVNIILDIIGVRLWGYQAACYVTALCQILLISAHYLLTRRMGISKILSLKSVIACIVVCLLLIPVCNLLYQVMSIRYCLIFLIAVSVIVLLIVKRNQIKLLISKYKKR